MSHVVAAKKQKPLSYKAPQASKVKRCGGHTPPPPRRNRLH